MAFFFKDRPSTATMLSLMASNISLKFADPNTKVIKITDDMTNEILSLTALTLETGGQGAERDITTISNPNGTPPPGINWDFGAEVIVGLKKLDELMVGKKHYGNNNIKLSPELVTINVVCRGFLTGYQPKAPGERIRNQIDEILR
jgi:hypothetical protein